MVIKSQITINKTLSRTKRDTWITREDSTRSKGSIKDSQRYIQFESLLNYGDKKC